MRNKSYVLRLWQTHPGEAWRVTLIPVEQRADAEHFTTIDEFTACLNRRYPTTPQLYTIAELPFNSAENT